VSDLQVTAGDTRTIVHTLNAPDEFVPSDLVWFTLKRSERDTDADAVFQAVSPVGVVLDGSTATVNLPPEATADIRRTTRLVWDFQLVTAGGAVHTTGRGTLTVVPDVTRSTTVD
jgi:hypothetical protein